MPDKVRDFLLKFKNIAAENGRIDLVPRNDTIATLGYLGLTKKNAKEILLTLSVGDYSEGPLDDDSRPELWVFGKEIRGAEVYIKLKAVDSDGIRIAKCVSFHIPQFPIKYPLR